MPIPQLFSPPTPNQGYKDIGNKVAHHMTGVIYFPVSHLQKAPCDLLWTIFKIYF